MKEFSFIDLFAGIGGFHHALSEMGGECVLAVEKDPHCRDVYSVMFPSTPVISDIREITIQDSGCESTSKQIAARVPAHDVLCAGFPCQPFSKSGLQQGVRDSTRGTLFFDIMSIVLSRKPRFIILENVRNLSGPRHAETWDLIIDNLQEAGFIVSREPLVLSPHRFPNELGGRPQARERVFIAGYRPDSSRSKSSRVPLQIQHLPSTNWNPQKWRIEEFLDDDSSVPGLAKYQLNPVERGWLDAWQSFLREIPDDHLPGFPIWTEYFVQKPRHVVDLPAWKRDFIEKNFIFYQESVERRRVIDRWLKRKWGPCKQTLREFPQSRQKFEWQARTVQPRREDRDICQLLVQFRPSGIRVKPATYMPALVAINQTSIIGSRMRRITPREAARLQGFPDEIFSDSEVGDSHLYRQLGNAVNVGVVQMVARALFSLASG
jgi:DNA (cytosine-5)-methyltransferase 1